MAGHFPRMGCSPCACRPVKVGVRPCGKAAVGAAGNLEVTIRDAGGTVVFTGTTDASGVVELPTLPDGTYTAKAALVGAWAAFAPRYDTTVSVSFTLPAAMSATLDLPPAAGYVCSCLCYHPLARTLYLSNDYGIATLVYNDVCRQWLGCQTTTGSYPEVFTDPYTGANSTCGDFVAGPVAIYWSLANMSGMSSCEPFVSRRCGYLVGVIWSDYGEPGCYVELDPYTTSLRHTPHGLCDYALDSLIPASPYWMSLTDLVTYDHPADTTDCGTPMFTFPSIGWWPGDPSVQPGYAPVGPSGIGVLGE